ncbi:hypothetical protein M409DRAFT_15754 [Zasmidium cellare ATCC 36951]|uniref:Peptidase A1 domain-containing protein n=1 Tax=Zasmidium cellare ATCC 36951 TaxID=1080233 RepID=A0A6A6D2Y4_ZASCE|nr:uncharacterized protein M409DRAFT_15754 [Zasmidium cellare ATCC 36951]KAF2173473.1 hypothetical protein M409DRAFT_15754 [Zasmidium cellare ATCC 36951]
MASFLLTLLATSAYAAPAASSQPPAILLTYNYGGYPRIQADIAWGTPAQKTVPTIFDTGSSGSGYTYHYTVGPCNKTVTNFYNWSVSKTHSKLDTKKGYSFSYGGNGKIVQAPSSINDSFSFANTKWPALLNNEVALSNWTVVTQLDDGCQVPESTFDHSILGLAPICPVTSGPSFRANLLSQGKTKSSSFSMWFDRVPKSVKSSYQRTAIFGAVPSKSKYTGELVRLKQNPPQGAFVGYYVSTPKLTATSITKPGKGQNIGLSDKSVKQCLLDSGTGQDRLPFSQEEALGVTGLIKYDKDAAFLAWNGSCDSIPPTATLNYTFAGATAGKSVTVAVPIRSYARGEFDEIPGVDTSKICGLSLSLDEYGDCTFGAPFFTAAFAVFNDEKKQVTLAQGGVSTGAADGPSGLGPITAIEAGQDVSGSV